MKAVTLDPLAGGTAIPDERKGERPVVPHTLDESRLPAILDRLPAQGLPNLFLPPPQPFMRGETLPVPGTGKLDLRAVRRMALERFGIEAGREEGGHREGQSRRGRIRNSRPESR